MVQRWRCDFFGYLCTFLDRFQIAVPFDEKSQSVFVLSIMSPSFKMSVGKERQTTSAPKIHSQAQRLVSHGDTWTLCAERPTAANLPLREVS